MCGKAMGAIIVFAPPVETGRFIPRVITSGLAKATNPASETLGVIGRVRSRQTETVLVHAGSPVAATLPPGVVEISRRLNKIRHNPLSAMA